jgi:L-lactate dehydrogenase complex protein LldE
VSATATGARSPSGCASGRGRARIALFITCLADTLFPQVGEATVHVLRRLGHEVVFPADQTCCGQMHANSGHPDAALALARDFLRRFDSPAHELIVTPSGSCAAMVRHHYPRLAEAVGDLELAAALRRVGERTFELSELLVHRLGVVDVGARFPHAVAYHPSCHSLRGLGLREEPIALLRAVSGLRLVALEDAESCCGFGGTFAVKLSEVSAAMMGDKTRSVIASGAEVLTALDCSCLMHIGGGLQRQRAAVRTMHLAEILACDGERT